MIRLKPFRSRFVIRLPFIPLLLHIATTMTDSSKSFITSEASNGAFQDELTSTLDKSHIIGAIIKLLPRYVVTAHASVNVLAAYGATLAKYIPTCVLHTLTPHSNTHKQFLKIVLREFQKHDSEADLMDIENKLSQSAKLNNSTYVGMCCCGCDVDV